MKKIILAGLITLFSGCVTEFRPEPESYVVIHEPVYRTNVYYQYEHVKPYPVYRHREVYHPAPPMYPNPIIRHHTPNR